MNMIFNDEARSKLFKGVEMLANAVQVTLGPKGRNVIIKGTHLTKDGVSVAKEVHSEDPIEEIGISLIRNACAKTCDDAGDGTTTSTILTRAIITEGLKLLAAGIDPYYIKKYVDADVKTVVDFIKSVKTDIDLDKVRQIATISANNDEAIGELLVTAYEKVGKEGVITIEEGNETYVKIVEGLQIERGMVSNYFINNTDMQCCELENVTIINNKGNLSDLRNILPVLEDASVNRKSVLILTESIEPDILDTLIINKIQNHLKICVVRVPFEQLLTIDYADKVTVTTSNTTIIAPNTQAKVAVIYVGAATQVELLEKKDRVEDAVCAVRSAIEEGVVPGGGWAYLNASKLLNKGILKKALLYPTKTIASNAGVSGEVVIARLLKDPEIGYDAKADEYCNMLEKGIVDSAKVVRVALENAASIATMFLLTECVIPCKDQGFSC